MANPKQVEQLKHNINQWNKWRQQHPELRPDLNGASLNGASLDGADLNWASLNGASLNGASLNGADLNWASLNGASLNGADLSRASLRWASLNDATLSEATLSEAKLTEAILIGAILSGAKLNGAILSGAKLNGASLNRANLNKANLINVDLSGTELNDANLRGVDLSRANLSSVDLSEADLSEAHFNDTHFARVDLRRVKGLETANHTGPSTININSVIFPLDDPTRKHFLQGIGFTETQIEYLPSLLTPRPIQYQSLFISYAHQDEAAAKRLHADLRRHDVPCWFAPHDLRPGDYHHSRIDEAIYLHEKLLLLLSEHAVNSPWVKHEVQIALVREIQQDCTVLFPLRLDQAVMYTSKDWATRLRESRHIGDFTGWQDEATYQEAFTTLLRHLKVTKTPTW